MGSILEELRGGYHGAQGEAMAGAGEEWEELSEEFSLSSAASGDLHLLRPPPLSLPGRLHMIRNRLLLLRGEGPCSLGEAPMAELSSEGDDL